jgi:4-hydroxy-4-methyl-2-oxoglutarate aldolase
MTTPAYATHVLDRARAFGTATLHEAAGRTGALPSRIRQITAGLGLAGRVLTVECAAMDNLWLHRAVVEAQPGDVLLVSVGEAMEAGYWGEVLSHAAVARGLGGLVIDGGVRDSAQLTGVGLPVFANRICMQGTVKDRAEFSGGIGQPLLFGDVSVATGDLVVGDEDGVAVFAAATVDRLLRDAQTRVDKETDHIRELHRGATTLDLMGLR